MKILSISMYYLPILGGQSTYISNLNRVFDKHGIKSFVLQRYSRFSAPNVIKLHHIPLLWKYIDSWFIFNLQIFFRRFFIRKFDIIISHYPFHYPVLAWHKRLIVLSHGLDWHQPPVSNPDKFRRYTANLMRKDTCCLVANDTYFLRYLGLNINPGEGFFTAIRKNKWLIPNCIDTNIFYNFEQPRKNRILVPRTVRPERGVHIAIEAFSYFVIRHPDFIMDIVGIYDPRWNYFQRCTKLIDELGLDKKINFLGAVEWEKLPSFYNQSVITLVPTTEMEGTSLSALESMSCGTPVISSNAGGLCDLPTKKTALHAKELSEKMEEVLLDWDHYSSSQMERTRSTFNLGNWSEAWLRVVKSVYNS